MPPCTVRLPSFHARALSLLASGLLLALAWSAQSARAADQPPPPAAAPAAAAPAPAPAGLAVSSRVYVTVAGDTLDRVVQKTMEGSPLRPDLLRQALLAVNPDRIPAGRNPRLKPGTPLQVPDHEALVRAVLMPMLPAGDPVLSAAHSASAPSGEQRRRWVRYP